jgi:shikimate kinase
MKEAAQLIIITGFMGAGKTEVAAALARRRACRMIDLDYFIEEREGRTPQAMIEEDGEPYFREIESRALRAAFETEALIIALGGGTWTISGNRAFINEQRALTVWLDAPFELCWRRIASEDSLRPLARDFLSTQRLYDERRTLYHQARLRVEVKEAMSADMIAAKIEAALKH